MATNTNWGSTFVPHTIISGGHMIFLPNTTPFIKFADANACVAKSTGGYHSEFNSAAVPIHCRL